MKKIKYILVILLMVILTYICNIDNIPNNLVLFDRNVTKSVWYEIEDFNSLIINSTLSLLLLVNIVTGTAL